ncbi:MAG: PAS domain S-box protein [Chloroflexota bacterium]|nr:PAS domain S-box protein [Chloroflexota bacterium]
MAAKTTYSELKLQMERLQRENASLAGITEQLRESEEKFKTIFESANDEIVYIDNSGTIIDINPKVVDIFGYSREESIGKKLYEFEIITPEEWQRYLEQIQDLVKGVAIQTQTVEIKARARSGERVYIEVNPRVLKKGGKIIGILAIIRDISERKRQEELLRRHTEQLDRLLTERTINLEELNSALKVMLQKVEELKAEIEDKITFNITEFVLPYVDKLRKTKLEDTQLTYLSSLEENLRDIASPFMHGLSTKYLKLTPTEIQVINLLKQGKTSKEIADSLFMSTRTIDTHRYNIRNKLGLKGRQFNLRTYLLSFEQ